MSSAKEYRRKLFTSIGQESLMWLEQAQELKLCGDMIWGELLAIKNVSQVLSGIPIKKLALVNSYMLLTGFSFENIIKGMLVAQNSALVAGDLNKSM